ncbi:DUF4345 domain-containing protein [Sphingosinicella rhizophila]|uniref:DUF4345 domain-containing protein n=1 Tax=Sphingosinicella rhizophila TaxID=3050082 RepID=A0ABU3QAE3_9SPHN|nr:DUF4345 domain-containing protein [Sphingosinicella sp. GR2756]MDT9600094.1 DUF4345 domain-containing protein [Sphingosinicella sp. GR2756]
MTYSFERRLLQLAILLASIVPLGMGTASIVAGATVIRGVRAPVPIDLDSHFRYLSGLLLGIGIAFLCALPRVERAGIVFRALGLVIVAGGLARSVSLLQYGPPGPGHLFGLGMELVVVPLIVIWQARIQRRYRETASAE